MKSSEENIVRQEKIAQSGAAEIRYTARSYTIKFQGMEKHAFLLYVDLHCPVFPSKLRQGNPTSVGRHG